MITTYPQNSLLGLPEELWNHIQPSAGWETMLRLGRTCRTARDKWQTLTASAATNYKAFQLFKSILEERYTWTVERVPEPLTHLKKLGNAYTGEPIAAIKLPCHDRIDFIHQRFVDENYPLQIVEDDIEKSTYVWQSRGITFAKCEGLSPPVWKEVNFGRQIRGFDFFGPKLLVIATVQNVLFLDRKTFKLLHEYPTVSNIQGIETDFENGIIKIANTKNIKKISFVISQAKSKSSILPKKLQQGIYKTAFCVKMFFKAFFTLQNLALVGKVFLSVVVVWSLTHFIVSGFIWCLTPPHNLTFAEMGSDLGQITFRAIKTSLVVSTIFTSLSELALHTYFLWNQIDYL